MGRVDPSQLTDYTCGFIQKLKGNVSRMVFRKKRYSEKNNKTHRKNTCARIFSDNIARYKPATLS